MSKNLEEHICSEAVFKRVYDRYSMDLHNFLYYKYGEQFHPKDKVQDAFIKLWNNCKNVTLDKAKSFLFTVANNMVLNEIKHNKVVLKYKATLKDKVSNESPEFLLEETQFLDAYKKALSELKEEQRVAFLLNKVEGKKHSEIAEFLGVTQKVVEYRIYTAFKYLKTNLEGFKLK